MRKFAAWAVVAGMMVFGSPGRGWAMMPTGGSQATETNTYTPGSYDSGAAEGQTMNVQAAAMEPNWTSYATPTAEPVAVAYAQFPPVAVGSTS